MKKEIYDHVIRVWPPFYGDLRAGPFGMFAGVSRTSQLCHREGSTASVASAPLPVTDSKDRWLSAVVVGLHFVHLFERPGVLTPSAMEKLVAAQMRVIVKVNDDPHPMCATFVMPSSGRGVQSSSGDLCVAIPHGAQAQVIAQLDSEVVEHLNGMVRDASGEWAPGDPGMMRIIRVSMTLEEDAP